MKMNIDILKESFEAIKPVASEIIDYFYVVHLKEHPEVKSRFDLKRIQNQKQVIALSFLDIFDLIDDEKKLTEYFKKLGGRRHQYGVEQEDFVGMGESLLKTLQYFFDDTWTPELADSWSAAICLIKRLIVIDSQPLPIEEKNGESMKEEIETVLKELMKESIFDLTNDLEVREMIKAQAKILLKEVLQGELSQLREKWKQQKNAA